MDISFNLQPRKSQKTIRTNPKTHKSEAPEIPPIITIKSKIEVRKYTKGKEINSKEEELRFAKVTHTKN